MTEDQNSIDNMEIEPLSDEELESVAGGTEQLTDSDSTSTPTTSTGPSCCSCSGCSN